MVLKIVLIVVAIILLGVCIWQGCLFARDFKRAKQKKADEKNKEIEKKGDKVE